MPFLAKPFVPDMALLSVHLTCYWLSPSHVVLSGESITPESHLDQSTFFFLVVLHRDECFSRLKALGKTKTVTELIRAPVGNGGSLTFQSKASFFSFPVFTYRSIL